MLSFAIALIAASASADPLVYVVNQQFGTVNLSTGAFRQIGPATPECGRPQKQETENEIH